MAQARRNVPTCWRELGQALGKDLTDEERRDLAEFGSNPSDATAEKLSESLERAPRKPDPRGTRRRLAEKLKAEARRLAPRIGGPQGARRKLAKQIGGRKEGQKGARRRAPQDGARRGRRKRRVVAPARPSGEGRSVRGRKAEGRHRRVAAHRCRLPVSGLGEERGERRRARQGMEAVAGGGQGQARRERDHGPFRVTGLVARARKAKLGARVSRFPAVRSGRIPGRARAVSARVTVGRGPWGTAAPDQAGRRRAFEYSRRVSRAGGAVFPTLIASPSLFSPLEARMKDTESFEVCPFRGRWKRLSKLRAGHRPAVVGGPVRRWSNRRCWALVGGGHLLLEGVPGPRQDASSVRTLADCLELRFFAYPVHSPT